MQARTKVAQSSGPEQATRRVGADIQPVLLRLPISHYCRKAEWGLTLAGIPYRTIDVTLPRMRQVRRANPVQRTVPVMVADQTILHGSHAILRWCDEHRADGTPPLYPPAIAAAVIEWEDWTDEEIGPRVRRLGYRVLASDPGVYAKDRTRRIMLRLQRPMFRAVGRYLKTAQHAKEDDAALPRIVDKVAKRLTDVGTGFLFTDHVTGADVATAALLEPMLPVAKVWALDEHPRWDQVSGFIRRIKPRPLARSGSRRVREKDWQAFEVLNRAHGTLKRPTAAEYD